MSPSPNVSDSELKKFSALSEDWWDPSGQSKVLHAINPLRINFIEQFTPLRDQSVLDIGCGGGILSEGLAKAGAQVTGIDLCEEILEVARKHARTNGLTIDYTHISAEDMAQQQPKQFDIVCCLEMLEHVPDPKSIVKAASQLVKPGGYVFFSTLNRTLKAYLLAVVGAEYILKLLPRGTHDYEKFIRPSELCSFARENGLTPTESKGLEYRPVIGDHHLSDSLDVNYILCCKG